MTKCNRLKLTAEDGKKYLTDVALVRNEKFFEHWGKSEGMAAMPQEPVRLRMRSGLASVMCKQIEKTSNILKPGGIHLDLFHHADGHTEPKLF